MKCDQNTRLDTKWVSATMAQVQRRAVAGHVFVRMQAALSN